MKGLIFNGKKDVSINYIPEPQPGKDEALVKVLAAAICGSDLHAYKGLSSRRTKGIALGHEIMGLIEKLPQNVNDESSLNIGDRVVVQPISYCGKCKWCLKGEYQHCNNRKLYGAQIPGGMAEKIAVPLRNLYPLNKDISDSEATLIEPLAVALRACSSIDLNIFNNILIQGVGPIGLLLLWILRHSTVNNIIVIDIVKSRLSVAEEWGADYTINSREINPIRTIKRIIGDKNIDVVFDTVGINASLDIGIILLKPGGYFIELAGWKNSVEIDLSKLVSSEIKLFSSFNYNKKDFEKSLLLASSGKIPLENLITHKKSLLEGPSMFNNMINSPENYLKVILLPQE